MLHDERSGRVISSAIPLDQETAYLQDVTHQTLQLADQIAGKQLYGRILQEFNTDLANYGQYIDSISSYFTEETSQQRTRRLGWIVQAAAIELLGSRGFISDQDRASWKQHLVSEVLHARQVQVLPGITIKIGTRYQNYMDIYADNPVTVEFIGQKGLATRSNSLKVATGFKRLVSENGSVVPWELIKEAQPEELSEEDWAVDLLIELAYLQQLAKQDNRVYPFVKKRLSLFQQLIEESDVVRSMVDVVPDTSHGFQMMVIRLKKSMSDRDRFHTGRLHIQPEEVTNRTWDFFRDLSNDPSAILDRAIALGHWRRVGKFKAMGNTSDNDSDSERGKPAWEVARDKWHRRRRR